MSLSLSPQPVPPPAAAGRALRVMKFGGTSMAGATRLKAVIELTRQALCEDRVLLVVSAMSGVTDLLADAGREAAAGRATDAAPRFRALHLRVLEALGLGPGTAARLDELEAGLSDLLRGVTLVRDCPPKVWARLLSAGERAAAALLAGLFEAHGLPCLELDAAQMLACSGDPREAAPRREAIRERFRAYRQSGTPLALLPGFFGGDAQGEPLLLGRGGSDFSAALAAAAVDARLLEIWTDVDGVHTADPRLVPEADFLAELSYEEAMELAHFGAKVLHPRTLLPVRDAGIPLRVRNSLRPSAPGTLVRAAVPGEARGVARGLTLLRDAALLDLSGPGLRGVPAIAAKGFTALAARDIPVLLVTQGSSECALTLCVRGEDLETASEALAAAFEAELAAGLMEPVRCRRELSILSLVGDGMRHSSGVCGALFGAIGGTGCNVVAIAQGASERSISAVLAAPEADRALVAVHHRFFGEPGRLDLFLLGVGVVGGELLKRLAHRGGADLRLCAVADSKRMKLDARGIDPAKAREILDREGEPVDLARMRAFSGSLSGTPVMVDCTSSEELCDTYEAFADSGFHLVAANKKASSGPLPRLLRIREALARRGRRFLNETNVGAGLPVLAPLRELRAAGDHVARIEGVVSGSLSLICGLLEEGLPLSEAVLQARALGTTEPDPREDLSGLDVARKALILHRELGGGLELPQVEVEGLLPADFDAGGDLAAFFQRLKTLDAPFKQRLETLKAEGRALRFIVMADAESCRVGPRALEAGHPLASVKGGENALSLSTAAYTPRPLVVRGYGAGAEVTALGVLGDILKLAGLK
ncbi:MAG TPA: bifunctional aspartate kinase/homoserine dehydrogenase I [Holophagaceae bacterium]|jgi:aspartokinase/homoserine dehydrogenase 1|nr:bifunctional aspartate kinase/homoserine dehydrogenase I [Holophagaceae bacterium]